MKQWINIETSYQSYVKAFFKMNPLSEADENEELKFKIIGQDFIYDLLVLLDILNPVVKAMEALQSFSAPIWKVVPYLDSVIKYLKSINFSTFAGLPRLKEHIEDLNKLVYKGVKLEPGYLVVATTSEPQPQDGKKRGPVNKTYTWSARDLNECEKDAQTFLEDLIKSVEARYQSAINNVCHSLYRCIDFHGLISCIVSTESNTGKPYNQVKLVKHGMKDFEAFVAHVNTLPHIKEDATLCFDPVMTNTFYSNIKSALASLV